MTNERASEKELGEVHSALAKWCMSILQGVPLLDKEGRAVLKEDGQPWLIPPSPAYLNVIRQLLKDNGIEAVAVPNSPMGDLSDLAFDEDSGNVVSIKKTSNQR